MAWPEQFEIIKKIISRRLAGEGKKYTFANASALLGVKITKLQAWAKGQRPSLDDVEIMARVLGLSPDWLLLEKGTPTSEAGSGGFIPDYAYICDTLHDLVYQLPDDMLGIARSGGMSVDELYACTKSLALPSALTIAKWIHAYRINANFLLAQVGHPLLSEAEYNENGPLTLAREKRGDFIKFEASADENTKDVQPPVSAMSKEDAGQSPFEREMLAYKRIQEELGRPRDKISDDLRDMALARFRGYAPTQDTDTDSRPKEPPGYPAVAEPPPGSGLRQVQEPSPPYGQDPEGHPTIKD